MRAIITCTTCIKDDNKIKRILEEINWIPSKLTDVEEFKGMMNEQMEGILDNIPAESKKIIEATTICTIYNGETKTWGIVNRPNKFLISFRLKNPLSTRLKAACRSLILSLRSYNGKFAFEEMEYSDETGKDNEKRNPKPSNLNSFSKISNKLIKISNKLTKISNKLSITLVSKISNKLDILLFKNEHFKFSSVIEILESGSDQSSFHGKIIQGSALKATRKEKRTEVSVLFCTLIFTALLLYITSPFGIKFDKLGLWGNWWEGNLQRVSTAAIVTMLVSIINLTFHWMSIRKEYPIKWVAEDVNE